MTRRVIISSIALVTFLALTSQAAMAHSTHDHSTVLYKWVMSKNLQAKIDRRISSANNSSFIGLNHFEQKKLEHYDIKVGNRFNTEDQGINFLMERTSGGIKVVDANRISTVAYTDQVPIKKTRMFSKASMNHKSHMQHDHSALPYEWTFGMGTQDKIIKAMVRSKKDVLIGLNAFEQSLLNEYEIRYGNIFQTTIKGHRFLIEKTTSGIKVVGHVDIQNVAMNANNYENM
jgi:hypothetical protein